MDKNKDEFEKEFSVKIDEDLLIIGDYDEVDVDREAEAGDGKVIKGNTAYPGSAVGYVKIVISRNKIDTVQEGEILVAAMTTPEYMPALKKASAFVTDEGGITSHAAIVARELKKPCIIGTKVATEVLKDGDLVEVDADKGIVRILE